MKLKLHLKRPGTPGNYPDLVLAIGSASMILVFLFLMGIPAFQYLQRRAYETAVRGNAATLQLAAETYAASNQGLYPTDARDLIEYLPYDEPLANPYTGKDGVFRNVAGDLTYRSPTNGLDYVIEAWGPGKDEQARRLIVLKGRQPRNK